MKTIKIFGLLLLTSLMFTACSKDDDEESAASVSGTKWETVYYETDMTGTSIVYDSKTELDNAYIYDVYEFKADGTVLLNDQNHGTWKQSGSTITLTDAEDSDFTEEWKLVNGQLVVDNSILGYTYVTKYGQITK